MGRKYLQTLEGGNHFIEIQAGDDDHMWLMIHSGSRHLGNVVAHYHNSNIPKQGPGISPCG